MAADSWRTRVAPRLLFYALILLAYLFICRLLVVYYVRAEADRSIVQLTLGAARQVGMDALAVSMLTLAALMISRWRCAAATIFMALGAAYLMLLGAINVRVMALYHQPATMNLLRYGDFLNVDGVRSLAKYMTKVDKFLLVAGAACVASFALSPLVGRSPIVTRPAARKLIFAVSLLALVAMPLHGLIGRHDEHLGSDSNAGWWLLKSAVAPLSGGAPEIARPDLLDPFETYAAGEKNRITTPERLRQAHIRNILIIVLESVGSEYLDLRGDRSVAPNLSGFMSRAAYFPNTYAQMPSSSMSLFSLMTGMYPPVSPVAIPMAEPGFPAPTLLERLGSAGKRTGVFSANWGFMDFARYFKGRAGHLEQVPDESSCAVLKGHGGAGTLAEQAVPAGAEECTFDSLARWTEQSDQDFAALLWTYGTHYPYGADPSDLASNPALAKQRYLAGIARTDRLVGQLLARLAKQGRLDDTLVVLVGDHGEAFGQHGSKVHGNDIYQEAIRVPLVFINARLFPGGVTDSSAVRMIDVAPTVLSLSGQPRPATMQGVDLSAPLRPRRVFFAAAWLNLLMGFREAPMKYNYAFVTDQLQAFDVARDPGERVDLGPRLGRARRAAIVRRIMNWKSAVEMKVAAARSAPPLR